MPKINIDYSKSLIYKIEHNDNPNLLYVGSTTDFTRRKSHHRSDCNNSNSSCYNYKLYVMIRENGGWESFKCMVIKEFPCNSKIELLIEEDKQIKLLKSYMNTRGAFLNICDYRKEYNETHKNEIKQYYKLYNEKNKNKNKEKYEANKILILEKMNSKVICACGSEISNCNKLRHEKTIKHINFMK